MSITTGGTNTPPLPANKFRILIIGGGITGLAAAIPLSKQGHNVTVFERAASSQENGGILGLSPNASRVLDSYGLWKALEEASELPPTHTILNHRGEMLDFMVHEEMKGFFGYP